MSAEPFLLGTKFISKREEKLRSLLSGLSQNTQDRVLNYVLWHTSTDKNRMFSRNELALQRNINKTAINCLMEAEYIKQ